MDSDHFKKIAFELKIKPEQVDATVALLDDEATVPFIARYRKEATGGLDEVAITAIRDRIDQLRELDKRREAILKSLKERELLTDELQKKIAQAETMAALEDIYLPFKPKRRTRASIARDRGLEPLAEQVFFQDDIDLGENALPFINPEKEINSVEEALAGARDIIAEWINEDTDARGKIRELYYKKAYIYSKAAKDKETEGAKYSDYFDWQEPIKDIPSHRFLAMLRGEDESVLSLHIAPVEEDAINILEKIFIISDYQTSEQVKLAIQDCYKRLLAPSMETEVRNEAKRKADREAIKIFTANLKELLMAPPLGKKDILAIDPGFRTGCKVVCLNRQGKLLDHLTIYPHGGEKEKQDAAAEIKALCEKYGINVIAIGNGTAGRETELFIKNIGLPDQVQIEIVDEAGASVYSASEVAREEFPDFDVTIRGAVSIGRRLLDPLAELVKIDPKAIGVGQYQHDVDQNALKQSLDDTVRSCVNAVGVEVNTASRELLTCVSGLGSRLAKNIIAYRNEHGPFKSREELKKVPRLGPKAFEQAAGFLRISDSLNPLDHSAVHPESYAVVRKIAQDLAVTINRLMEDEDLRRAIDLNHYVTDNIGLPTLEDILEELARPGRDPRAEYMPFKYDDSVRKIEDLKPGMKLPGIVTNVTAFGAFVDIGVHQDGLIHKSQLSDRYVNDPHKVIRVHQKVMVRVLDIDLERMRISLSLKN